MVEYGNGDGHVDIVIGRNYHNQQDIHLVIINSGDSTISGDTRPLLEVWLTRYNKPRLLSLFHLGVHVNGDYDVDIIKLMETFALIIKNN